ncbi:hypothetical protein AVEN_163021-1 [Araneus ventricosus]|uniref:Uncharacterized protein n=1 Tax=Araneus ventricosus TaxID=182803 RepID=A0A4Y2J991_ARAVE|nr:hypothetical protein AVEN_163021-1 [Araneus ventricosus]
MLKKEVCGRHLEMTAEVLQAGNSRPLNAKTGIQSRKLTRLSVEAWISSRSRYPSLHLDCRAIKAEGVGTWRESTWVTSPPRKSEKAGIVDRSDWH